MGFASRSTHPTLTGTTQSRGATYADGPNLPKLFRTRSIPVSDNTISLEDLSKSYSVVRPRKRTSPSQRSRPQRVAWAIEPVDAWWSLLAS
jgi:hypothetical protein